MTDHDPLCPLRHRGDDPAACIECAHARRIRADERERIAQAIESKHSEYDPSGDRWHACTDGSMHDALELAARIARGGIDE